MAPNGYQAAVTGFSSPIAGVTALTLGVYGFAVVAAGNAVPFVAALRQDMFSNGQTPGFIKWLLAVLIILALGASPTFHPYVGSLYVLVITAMLLNLGQTDFFNKIASVWNTL